MGAVEWVRRDNKARWQPQRSDGRVLASLCGMGMCVAAWVSDDGHYPPRLYWWKWLASLRGLLGDWAQRRRLARELVGRVH